MPLSDEKFIEHCDKIIADIDSEGLDYYLTDYESPDKFRVADPVLFRLWNQYLFITGEIKNHLNTAGGRRKDPNEPEEDDGAEP
jgi:hypothetical protein